MKRIILSLLIIFLTSCNVEKRIHEYSYTNEWYYLDNQRYQVYQTKSGEKYIIVLNKNQDKLKRKYIK